MLFFFAPAIFEEKSLRMERRSRRGPVTNLQQGSKFWTRYWSGSYQACGPYGWDTWLWRERFKLGVVFFENTKGEGEAYSWGAVSKVADEIEYQFYV